VQSSVIGGAMLPHAPQFFTMPETEDRATVERVKAVAKEIGGRLKALEPALWLIFANDHAEQFFHNVAPPFTVHVGASASGHFAGRSFHWRVPGEIGFERPSRSNLGFRRNACAAMASPSQRPIRTACSKVLDRWCKLLDKKLLETGARF
jgi:hypothetical protein